MYGACGSQGVLNYVLICQPLETVVQPITRLPIGRKLIPKHLNCHQANHIPLLLKGRAKKPSHWFKAHPLTGFWAAVGRQSWPRLTILTGDPESGPLEAILLKSQITEAEIC